MGNRNESMLRANYEAFATDDVKPLLDSLTDDIEWSVSGPSPLAREYTGKTEVLAFFGNMMELYRGTLRGEVVDIIANDQRGIVLTKEEAQYEGKKLQFRSVHVWEIRDGKLAKFNVYYDDAYHQFWSSAHIRAVA